MAFLLAYRISRFKPASFSIAMNDYGFELLTDEDIPIEQVVEDVAFFSIDNLLEDIQHSLNANEMALVAVSGISPTSVGWCLPVTRASR